MMWTVKRERCLGRKRNTLAALYDSYLPTPVTFVISTSTYLPSRQLDNTVAWTDV